MLGFLAANAAKSFEYVVSNRSFDLDLPCPVAVFGGVNLRSYSLFELLKSMAATASLASATVSTPFLT